MLPLAAQQERAARTALFMSLFDDEPPPKSKVDLGTAPKNRRERRRVAAEDGRLRVAALEAERSAKEEAGRLQAAALEAKRSAKEEADRPAAAAKTEAAAAKDAATEAKTATPR